MRIRAGMSASPAAALAVLTPGASAADAVADRCFCHFGGASFDNFLWIKEGAPFFNDGVPNPDIEMTGGECVRAGDLRPARAPAP